MNEKIKMFLKILELEYELADKSINYWKNEIKSLTEEEEIGNAYMELGFFTGIRSNCQGVKNMINEYFNGESND